MQINFQKFKNELGSFKCFSLNDAKKHFPNFDRKRLTEWQKKDYLRKIAREYYLFTDVPQETKLWWYIANFIFEPSYISLHTALSYYGFIPEAVFQVTSITTKRTNSFQIPETTFNYRNIKKKAYFGYTLILYEDVHHIRLAEPEKALLDLLYLEPSLEENLDFDSMRFNIPVILETINPELMEGYAQVMENKAFYNRYKKFKLWLNA